VTEIEGDDGPTALADEGWARISVAGFDPFEAEALDTITVVKFHHIG
jgi:hypothetical protein